MPKTTCEMKYLIGHLLKVSEDKPLTSMVGSVIEGRRQGIGAVAVNSSPVLIKAARLEDSKMSLRGPCSHTSHATLTEGNLCGACVGIYFNLCTADYLGKPDSHKADILLVWEYCLTDLWINDILKKNSLY